MDKRINIFISYSWEEAGNKEWVNKLKNDLLSEERFNVILDQREFGDGTQNKDRFIVDNILNSDFIIVILTPSYVYKANKKDDGTGITVRSGVEIETEYIMMRKHEGYKCIIPILRVKEKDGKNIPGYLKNLDYIDMSSDKIYNSALNAMKSKILCQDNTAQNSIETYSQRSDFDGKSNMDFGILFSFEEIPVRVSLCLTYKGTKITLEHQQVMHIFKTLARGEVKADDILQEDKIMFNCKYFSLELNTKYYKKLINELRENMEKYCKRVIEFEARFETHSFDTFRNDYSFSIVTVKRSFWYKMLETSNYYDWDNGKTEWHIFQKNGGYVHVFSPVVSNNNNYNPGEHASFYAVKSDNINSDDVVIFIKISDILNSNFGNPCKINRRDTWGIRTARDWMIYDFIPFVCKKNHIDITTVLDSISRNEEDIISKMQYFYMRSKASVTFEELKNLRDALAYCLEKEFPSKDFNYITSKLSMDGLNLKEQPHVVAGAIRDYLYTNKFESYINNNNYNCSKADDFLRCLMVFTDSNSSYKICHEDFIFVKNLLKSLIEKMNKVELIEKYDF
ncbi:toll/interleukin-1 receptor domain-containing protein [Desulfosporosinus sp. FKB]|uniref:toll/interleukin-1 receptor domain-containing protein n=1 Tax=Desulfosporosinus sp. FKB TaxID=1969835 RepID=UPI000B4A1415|nr:toll/interleukin-1 receptor domain-containing protein [Desulfosporosinus sp. FKB]